MSNGDLILRSRPSNRRLRPCLAVLLISGSLLVQGCSFQRLVANQMAPSLREMSHAFRSERSVRHAREAGPALLALLDGFLSSAPDNEELLLLSAEMNAAFAFAFMEQEDPDWARELYRKARLRAMVAANGRLPGFAEAANRGGEDLQRALQRADRADVPVLFWAGFSWGAWINLSRGNPEALKDLPRVEAIMTRIQKLDASYFHGGADLFFGFYYGGRTRLLGGDPERSKKAFQRVFELHGDQPFLMARVLYAETYAVNTGDREAFEAALEVVINTPADALPEETLANSMAKKRAEALLDEVDDLFPPPPPPLDDEDE